MQEVHVRYVFPSHQPQLHLRCSSQPATINPDLAMQNNEQLHLARVRQVEQVHAASRSSARATLPPAGCWRWVMAAGSAANATHPPRRLSSCSQTYCKLHVLSAVPTCHARVSSKRSPEAGRNKNYCFVSLGRRRCSRAFRWVSHQPSRIPCAFSAWPSPRMELKR